MNLSGSDNPAQKLAIQCWSDREQELVAGAEQRRRTEDRGKIHSDFLDAAAGHQRDPIFCWIQLMLRCVLRSPNRRGRKFRERMANKSRVDSAVAVELFFERKDHQRLVDVVAEEPHSSLPPCPELRRDIVHRGNTSPLHLASHSPVEGWGVDDDCEVRFPLVCFADKAAVQAKNFREVAEDFGDADYGEVFRIDDGVATFGPHAFPTYPKERNAAQGYAGGIGPRPGAIDLPQRLNQLRAVHFTRGFAGRDEE